MKPTPPAAPADPVLLALAVAVLTVEALLVLTAAAVALALTVAGWRLAALPPGPVPAAPAAAVAPPAPVVAATPAPPAPAAQLDARTVAQLRRLARAAGLPQLARSGRRADLLAALAPAPG
jgi:hypothetical protein